MLRKHAPGTVRNVLRQLGTVFSWAKKEGLCPANPCHGVERPTAPQTLDFLSKEEVRLLLDSAEARSTTLAGRMLHVALAIAVRTGLRKGEILGLRWIDLDFQTRRLTVARSYRGTPKSGKTRHLRLPQALLPLLQSWRPHCPHSPEGVVLPLGQNANKVAGRDAMLGLPALLRKLGLREALHPWHLLRHTFASHYVMAGGNILALQKILGHSDLKMTMIYAHLAPDFLEGEMDKVQF